MAWFEKVCDCIITMIQTNFCVRHLASTTFFVVPVLLYLFEKGEELASQQGSKAKTCGYFAAEPHERRDLLRRVLRAQVIELGTGRGVYTTQAAGAFCDTNSGQHMRWIFDRMSRNAIEASVDKVKYSCPDLQD